MGISHTYLYYVKGYGIGLALGCAQNSVMLNLKRRSHLYKAKDYKAPTEDGYVTLVVIFHLLFAVSQSNRLSFREPSFVTYSKFIRRRLDVQEQSGIVVPCRKPIWSRPQQTRQSEQAAQQLHLAVTAHNTGM